MSEFFLIIVIPIGIPALGKSAFAEALGLLC